MSINVNSFILPDNIINKMKNKIEESKKKGLELGFNLYTKEDTKELQDTSHCIGMACEITMDKTCQNKGNYVGRFHAHPTMSSLPSIQDLAVGHEEGMTCVGGASDNKIRCYTRKERVIFRPTLEFIKSTRDIYEKPARKVKEDERRKALQKELSRARKFIQDNHFNTINII